MSDEHRILVVGSAGQLGRELQVCFADFGQLFTYDRNNVDLSDPVQVRRMVAEAAPDIILNAAAYTAVDRAESEPDQAMAVNGIAPGVLAEEALRRGSLLVHYSTDYVFDGSKQGPWLETDTPNPLSVYGATKLAGEQAIARVGGKYLTFRTSWVYGPHGNNFLLTMLRLGSERDSLTIVEDQFGAPTTSSELATGTRRIVEGVVSGRFGAAEEWAGLYHMTCGGATTWHGFAERIFAQADGLLKGTAPKVQAIPSSSYPTPARRPRNSILSNEKLNSTFSVRLSPWEDALTSTLHVLTAGR